MKLCPHCKLPATKMGKQYVCPNSHLTPEEHYLRILECSTRGNWLGRQLSALNAEVTVLGVRAPIEVHYQLAKRWEGKPAPTDWRQAKGRKPDYLQIGPVRLSTRFATAWYYLLWLLFLDSRPDLVCQARGYDDFRDSFARPGTNSQADAIRLYIKKGRNSILHRPDVQLLLASLREAGVNILESES